MKDLVEFPLKVMNIYGYLTRNPNRKTTVIHIITELSVAINLFVSTLNYFYSEGIDGLTDNLQFHSSWFNVFVKLSVCMYYKAQFLNLFEKRKNFWNTNNCSTATKKNVSWILNTVSFMQRAFVGQIVVLYVFLLLIAIFKRTLAYGTLYISVEPLTYFIIWLSNIISLVGGATATVALDCLFIGLCYEVVAQFRIVYDHFERLDVENINSKKELQDFVDKFKLYSEHHKFLLRYIRDIRNCFSIIYYLSQYLTIALSCCTYMYAAMESTVFMRKLFMVLLMYINLCQSALYCIPATYMIEEAPKIANAIYNSKWYGNHFNQLKKATQLKIHDAQKEIRMSALGGMVEINSKTLIQIVRTSYSICTVLRHIKK